ncbi:MAG: dynamin family protein [gamma proteobacterium endosymbiont of Lamellibrachia anaximandri]|nr:dynamin family protein [gamma proteobacterium endosymbiont of Lamellibrachia anaximandri]
MIIENLFTARDQAERLRIELTQLMESEQQAHRATLREEIENVKDALDKSKVPEHFRIAIVGTFKTGKSSFVNKLAEERLAGVETNPETAAISIFRYAEKPRAEVTLITSSEWARMEDLYEDNPKHPEAYRVAGLKHFNEEMSKRKDRAGSVVKFEPINPESLVGDWLKPEGYTHIIESEKWDTKAGKQAFRKKIRDFTSSRNPLHYFVKELAVYAPVPLLRDHVELIDTPGLNDTQLYRGQLTEELLSEVDAILFLTRSGASFSQYDKEFIVRQLRKNRLRHLRLVVTQVDTTFESARHDAMDEDEDPPTFLEVQEKEELRLRAEIRRTLDELLEDSDLNDEDGLYYIEQLDALKIHFTSARWFDDGRIEDSGIPAVRNALIDVLSENYHFNQMVEHLERTINAVRSRLRVFFNERRSVMEAEFDPKKVEASLAQVEKKLDANLAIFENRMKDISGAHDIDQSALQELMDANISRMQLMARAVLSEFEKNDVSRHWKTRRHGYWGYLNVLGEKVADKVFPVMESSLNRKIKPFGDFLDLSSGALDGLQSEIEKLETESEIDGLPKIEFSQAKERFMKTYVDEMRERVDNEKDVIIEVLEEFATGELKEKLSGAKGDVAEVWGTGTTIRQSSVVSAFYDDVGNSLSNALSSFLEKRMQAFGQSLSKNAKSLFPKLKASIQSMLDTRKQLIQEHLTLQTGEARSQLENYLEKGIRLIDGEFSLEDASKEMPEEELKELDIDIMEGKSGYSYANLFGAYLAEASHIQIKDPYLRFRYQLNNFNHFCSLAVQSGSVKKIDLTTGKLDGDDKDLSDSYLEDIKRRLSDDYSIDLNWKRESTLHAREIKVDDEWVILSDRGLDIYQKPESRNEFGHFDLALRKCKQTKVHIHRAV